MKYPVVTYAKALALAIEGQGKQKNEEIAKNFLELVRRNGDEVHLSKIVEAAERFVHQKSGLRTFVVESARPLDPATQALVKSVMKPDDRMQTKINPELVAGIKILVNDELQFDGSLKGKLDKLFGNDS
jgi:F0F1-type ATP synthase delta subunit